MEGDILRAMAERQSKVNFRAALWAELKQSKGYQIVTALYGFAAAVSFVMWLISTRSPAQLLTSWTRSDKLILVLILICVGLIILLFGFVAGARRIHEKTVGDINSENGSKVRELKRKYIRRRRRINKKFMAERFTLGQYAKDLTNVVVIREGVEEENNQLKAAKLELEERVATLEEQVTPKVEILFENKSSYVEFLHYRRRGDPEALYYRIYNIGVKNISHRNVISLRAEFTCTCQNKSFDNIPFLLKEQVASAQTQFDLSSAL